MPNDFDDLSRLLSHQTQRSVDEVRSRIERDLSELGERISARILREAERRLDRSLSELAERTLDNALRSFERRHVAQQAEVLSRATGLPSGLSEFASDFTQTALLKIFSAGTSTRTRSRETAESQEAANSFRESRAQAQARLAEAVIRGQRNL